MCEDSSMVADKFKDDSFLIVRIDECPRVWQSVALKMNGTNRPQHGRQAASVQEPIHSQLSSWSLRPPLKIKSLNQQCIEKHPFQTWDLVLLHIESGFYCSEI